jgi:hypothetical protein
MAVVITAAASIITFIIALWMFHIVPLGTRAISISKNAIKTIHDDRYNDAEREKAMQQASILLAKVFFSIFYRTLLVFAASLLPIWITDWAGLVKSEDVTTFLFRTDVILITSFLLILIYFIGKKLWHSK